MKKLFVSMLVAVAASVPVTMFAGTPIQQSELPKSAQSFITKYFAGDAVKKVEKEEGRRGMEYEVDFTSGAEAEFMTNGEWKEVKAAKGQTVPADLVPAAIAKYVESNKQGKTIVEISRKRGGYEIKLSDGSELRLTEDAKPMQQRQGNRGGNRGGQGGRGQGQRGGGQRR